MASGYDPEWVENVRAGCLFLATVLGDLLLMVGLWLRRIRRRIVGSRVLRPFPAWPNSDLVWESTRDLPTGLWCGRSKPPLQRITRLLWEHDPYP
jgi:hypothetical protein